MKLSSKLEVVVVTVASAGLGRAIVLEFAREGARDIWVNNAMATVFAPFDLVTPEEFKRATEVTYLGSVMKIDWRSVFFPSVGVGEIFLRGIIIYLFLFFILRLLRREAGAIGISDLLLVVLIADAAQNAMSSDYSTCDKIGARSPLTYRLHGKKKTRMTKKKRTRTGSFFSSHYSLCQ